MRELLTCCYELMEIELRAPQPGTVSDYCPSDQNTTALTEDGFLIPQK